MFRCDNWNLGVYIRLSQEDGDDKDESNSITNQRNLINQFIENEEKVLVIDYYIDDGYSGTTFDRPGFKRMMEDIKSKKINCVIVKDLSRFGRNYIEVGNYLEQIFPLYDLRFISINDEVDNYKNPESISNIIVPFKNLMNDEYARDISNKVKASFYALKKKGLFIGSIAPYGYVRDPNDKHKLIVDENVRDVIETIFKLSLEGKGVGYISDYLNKKNVLSPFMYKKKVLKSIKKYCNYDEDHVFYWNSSGVKSILKNRAYCGDMVQNKRRVISYKIHKSVKIDKEDYIIVEDTHEAIISKNIFEKVQEGLFSRASRASKTGEKHILAGYIKCGDCDRCLTKYKQGKWITEPDRINYMFRCSTYARRGKTLCTPHRIDEETMYIAVLNAVKMQIDLIINMEKAIDKMKNSCDNEILKSSLEQKMSSLKNEYDEKMKAKRQIYKDWKDEIISEDDYYQFSNIYDKEINQIVSNINDVKKQQCDISFKNNNDWILEFKKYKNINTLTREMVIDLIDNVYLYEGKRIEVKFKYDDEYKKIIELLESTTNGKK